MKASRKDPVGAPGGLSGPARGWFVDREDDCSVSVTFWVCQPKDVKGYDGVPVTVNLPAERVLDLALDLFNTADQSGAGGLENLKRLAREQATARMVARELAEAFAPLLRGER